MISVKVPHARLIQDPTTLSDDVDPELVEIAKGLRSFKGFVATWNGRDMALNVKADFEDPSDAVIFKLSL